MAARPMPEPVEQVVDLSAFRTRSVVDESAKDSGSAAERDTALPNNVTSVGDKARWVSSRQVSLLYKHATLTFLVTLFNALLLTFIQWRQTHSVYALAWLGVIVFITLGRAAMTRQFNRTATNNNDLSGWGKAYAAGSTVSGIAWGTAAIFLYPEHSIPHQVFLAFVLGGMVAGAVSTLASVRAAFLGFALPALLPIGARFLSNGDELHLAMGTMTALYALAMVVTAMRLHTTIDDSLGLRFDNTGLNTYQKELKADIENKERAEQALKAEKQQQQELIDKLKETQTQLLQSEKMASIGQLAAGVAHEINNPVGYINSNLTTLVKYLGKVSTVLDVYEEAEVAIGHNPDMLDKIRSVKTSVDLEFLREDIPSLVAECGEGIGRVKQIVNNLKDFSRSDDGEWQWANIHNGMDSTLNIVNNELKYKAEVIKEYGNLPDIECLPSQLNQVFMNLLVNAAQAIENSGTITIRTSKEATNWVRIEISDTGQGIPPENIKHLFDPFFTTKPVGKGTGLGLSLSYSIVNKHGGRIEVQSEEGRGTSFTVWLPVTQTHEEVE